VKIRIRVSRDTGRNAIEADANRMIIPDHFALVIFCTATNATLPAERLVK
jgi:hypothetical protein